MANFILIFTCFLLGIFFRRYKFFPANTPQVLNRFVIYISLPALTLSQIHRLDLAGNILIPVSMSWILYALGVGFFYTLGKYMQIPKKSLGTLMLTGSLGNTSFVGFPLLEALFGVGAISVGILVDQPGTFLVAGTLGVATAAYFSGANVSAKQILRKVFSFPPFLALLFAFVLRLIPFHDSAYGVLDRLGSTLVPLSLLSVGMQLHFHPEKIKANFKYLCWGLGFKLFLAPLFFVALYVGIFHQRGEVVLITLVESAMAPMITAGILATEYDLDVELSNLMLGIGIPLSLITVPVWSWVLDSVRFI
ncbi:AEC family transporter [Bdellovibrio sp. HCB337]|uniref:AEC family transporter n=1 Tax=Bdellovibrio sp. HCB337 TaxID=3394358 RepID=UPI0039A61A83